MRQRVRLNVSRKNGFVVTVSTGALKVDSLIEDPAHRLKDTRVLERRDDVDGVGSANGVARLHVRCRRCEPVHPVDVGPGMTMGEAPAPGTNISSCVGITNPDQKRKWARAEEPARRRQHGIQFTPGLSQTGPPFGKWGKSTDPITASCIIVRS